MNWTTFNVSSVTNAMRGKKLLETRGFTAYIQRSVDTDDTNGCGYSLLVKGNADEAEKRLRAAGIRIRQRKDGRSL